MDQKVIIDSIGDHMNTIETFVDWIIVLAIAIAWAGIRRDPQIEALGIKFNRRHAFFALAALVIAQPTPRWV